MSTHRPVEYKRAIEYTLSLAVLNRSLYSMIPVYSIARCTQWSLCTQLRCTQSLVVLNGPCVLNRSLYSIARCTQSLVVLNGQCVLNGPCVLNHSLYSMVRVYSIARCTQWPVCTQSLVVLNGPCVLNRSLYSMVRVLNHSWSVLPALHY